ncbi:MAG: response regulator [Planctomycetes bacterium]|nr:response regulator [Planctomycetota bacterium]
MMLTTQMRVAWVMGLVLAVVSAASWPAVVLAQDEDATTASDTGGVEVKADAQGNGVMGLPEAEASLDLQMSFQQMVHYWKIAKFDLARTFAQAVVQANPEPTVLLKLVEHPEVGYVLLSQMAVSEDAELVEAAKRLLATADEGIMIKRKDHDRMVDALKALDKNERSYQINLQKLQLSGEYVVPPALGLLASASESALHDDIMRALVEIDRPVVYPLVMALETPDKDLKLKVISLLGKLGYKMALPALKAQIDMADQDPDVKAAATAAMAAIGGPAVVQQSAGQLYGDLAEAFYYNKITTVSDPKRPTTDVWGCNTEGALAYRPAPTEIVNEIVAARCCELGLRAAPDSPELVALWLSIQAQMNYELAMIGGEAKNPWAPADVPTTEFFLRSAGQQYLNQVLARALNDNRVEVADQAIEALQKVVNQDFLGATSVLKEGSPLIRALEYPNRRIRFNAAFAIVACMPRKPFFGADRVVPVLAEAVNLETGRGALIVDADENNLNTLTAEFRKAGWSVGTAANGNDGVSMARTMPRIDTVVLGTNVDNVAYTEVIQLLRTDFATALVPIVLVSGEDERVPFSFLKENVKYIDSVPVGTSAAEIMQKTTKLLADAGSVALAPEESKAIALRAAANLKLVAGARLSFTADAARGALLAAAAGQNEELAIAAMDILVPLADDEIQQKLADIALAEGASKPIQIAALNAIAQTARHIGNKLTSASVTTLMKKIETETDNDIRDAVGTVLGALDLEAKLASQLIREHAVE